MLFLLLALAKIVVVVAAIAQKLAPADFHDAADELIQELAIVRDQQDRAGIGLQIALEPHQRIEVEVVGRLVEHQQVGLLDEQAGEVCAHHPAAAHRAQGPVEIPFAERQPAQNCFGPRLELVAAERLIPRLHGVKIFRLGIVAGIERLHPPLKLDDFRRDPRRQLQHRLVADRRGFLRQMADRRLALDRHFARVRRVASEDQREQRGLARAVRADQPDAVVAVDLERHVLE